MVTQELTGPTTKGAKVIIGKNIIKLPDDAYIDYLMIESLCAPGAKCPQTPEYGIIRGKSRMSFSSVDGEIVIELIAQGEMGTFDFMKDFTKRKTPSPTTSPTTTIRPPAAVGPTSKGANIEIAGKSLKLTENAYIDAFIVSTYCFMGQRCPKAPAYRINIGKSWIEFSAVDGEIIQGRQTTEEDMAAYDALETRLNLKKRGQ